MRLKQICMRLPEKIIRKLEEIRELTNIPISDQIKLLIAGYKITRIDDGKDILSSESLFT